ncbi:MAG: spore coat associated protein CotJA [Clostridia bacterium]|nr:spore coat associated protein CotJA [Clostridia bacterium]
MAFVDMQPFENVYSMSDAFSSGTLFPNLDKPFYGGRCK